MSLTRLRAEMDEDEMFHFAAYFAYQDSLNANGFPINEATDPVLADRKKRKYRFVAGDPVTDFSEKAKKDKEDEYRKAMGERANMNGLIFPVYREDV